MEEVDELHVDDLLGLLPEVTEGAADHQPQQLDPRRAALRQRYKLSNTSKALFKEVFAARSRTLHLPAAARFEAETSLVPRNKRIGRKRGPPPSTGGISPFMPPIPLARALNAGERPSTSDERRQMVGQPTVASSQSEVLLPERPYTSPAAD